MAADKLEQERLDLVQGTLDMMILRTLQWGAQHGHGIGQAIRAGSDEVLRVERGSLYPALHRLERRDCITSDWKITENKQRAKYYRLTAAGKKNSPPKNSVGTGSSKPSPALCALSRGIPVSWLKQHSERELDLEDEIRFDLEKTFASASSAARPLNLRGLPPSATSTT